MSSISALSPPDDEPVSGAAELPPGPVVATPVALTLDGAPVDVAVEVTVTVIGSNSSGGVAKMVSRPWPEPFTTLPSLLAGART